MRTPRNLGFLRVLGFEARVMRAWIAHGEKKS